MVCHLLPFAKVGQYFDEGLALVHYLSFPVYQIFDLKGLYDSINILLLIAEERGS